MVFSIVFKRELCKQTVSIFNRSLKNSDLLLTFTKKIAARQSNNFFFFRKPSSIVNLRIKGSKLSKLT